MHPDLLGRHLNDIERKFAPGKLYAAGPMEIPLPPPRVAMVGTREATPKGVADAGAIAKSLRKEGPSSYGRHS